MITKLMTYLSLFLHIFILQIEGYGWPHVGVRGKIARVGFLFLLCGARDRTQVLGLGRKKILSLEPLH